MVNTELTLVQVRSLRLDDLEIWARTRYALGQSSETLGQVIDSLKGKSIFALKGIGRKCGYNLCSALYKQRAPKQIVENLLRVNLYRWPPS